MPEQNYSFREIRDFTKFLEKCLGRKVFEYSSKSLTKPGDHYGSIMQSVNVNVLDNNGCNKVIVKKKLILIHLMCFWCVSHKAKT